MMCELSQSRAQTHTQSHGKNENNGFTATSRTERVCEIVFHLRMCRYFFTIYARYSVRLYIKPIRCSKRTRLDGSENVDPMKNSIYLVAHNYEQNDSWSDDVHRKKKNCLTFGGGSTAMAKLT